MADFSPQYLSQQTVSRTLKDGTPTDDELEGLANEIVEWEKLGRRLGVSDPKLEETNQARDKLSEKGYHMLKHWKQENGSSATYKALCDALKHKFIQRKDLAERFCYINGNIQDKLEQMENQVKNVSEKMDNLREPRDTSRETENLKETLEQMGNQVKNSSRESSQDEDKLQQMKSEIRKMSDKLDTLMARRETDEEDKTRDD